MTLKPEVFVANKLEKLKGQKEVCPTLLQVVESFFQLPAS